MSSGRGEKSNDNRFSSRPRTRLQLGKLDRPLYKEEDVDDSDSDSDSISDSDDDDDNEEEEVVVSDSYEEDHDKAEGKDGGGIREIESVDACEAPLKRRKFSGIEVVHSVGGKESIDSDDQVANSTRSHFSSEASKEEFGTACNPVRIDEEDEPECDSSYSDRTCSSLNQVNDNVGEEEESTGKSTQRKDRDRKEEAVEEANEVKSNHRKRAKAPKTYSDVSDGEAEEIVGVTVIGRREAHHGEKSKGKSKKRKCVKSVREEEDVAVGSTSQVIANGGEKRDVQRKLSKRKSEKRDVQGKLSKGDVHRKLSNGKSEKRDVERKLSKGQSEKRKHVKDTEADSIPFIKEEENIAVAAQEELSKERSSKKKCVKATKVNLVSRAREENENLGHEKEQEVRSGSNVGQVNTNGGEHEATKELSKENSNKKVKAPKADLVPSVREEEDGAVNDIHDVNVNAAEKEAAQEKLSKGKSSEDCVKSPKANFVSSAAEKDDRLGDNVCKMDANGGENEAVKEDLSKEKFNKSKRVKAVKTDALFKLLIDTMLSNSKELPEELNPSIGKYDEQARNRSFDAELLPLIFTFEDEDSMPVEKTEQEMSLDELWSDYNFAIESENICSYRPGVGQSEDVNVPESEANPTSPCANGEHHLILNEQIGYVCKLCSKVVKEIKEILPCWSTRVGGTPETKSSILEELPLIFHDVSTTKDNVVEGSSTVLEGTVWDLIPGVQRTLYQHQREAFEFIWKNLTGSIQLDQLNTCAAGVGGCVISHPPGTGKTRLSITFIQTYLKAFPECRPIIVAPRGILLTWEKELRKWDANLPFHNLNLHDYSGSEDAAVCELVHREPKNRKRSRLVKLYSWEKGSGILGLSYGLFKTLSGECTSGDPLDAGISRILLEKPGLLVLDEGHTPRNDRTLVWKALEKVQTKQRIILSGTPFQNSFAELYNTLHLVRPKFTEGKGKVFSRTNCITEGGLEELRLLIKPFVHVYNGKILDGLPGLRDCLIYLEPRPLQKLILNKIDLKKSVDNDFGGALEVDYKISLASVHPSLLTAKKNILSEKEKSLVDEQLLEKLRLDPNEGVKTSFVLEMVRLSDVLKEKVVIFSQYLLPLFMIKDQLSKQFCWTEGKEVLQMDGKIPSNARQTSIDSFNDPSSNVKVLLASTKACCEGICLTGASRVILLDIVWNPSVERQAISRAYRIGQDKVVHVYHLITAGTSEGDKYEKQAKKNHLSNLIFSPEINMEDIKRQPCQEEEGQLSRLISEDKILGEMVTHDKLIDMFAKIYYQPKESNPTIVLS